MEVKDKPSRVDELAKLLSNGNLRDKAIQALEHALSAQNCVYDIGAKRLAWYEDSKIQVHAAEVTLAYTDGKPVERKEVVTRMVSTREELEAKLRQSPELRAEIESMLRQTSEETALPGKPVSSILQKTG